MHPIISIIALILNVMLITRQIQTWKVRCLLSPGFYFGFIWIMGLLGVIILHPVGILLEPYPQYIDELSIFVGFTALCFLLLTPYGRDKVNVRKIRLFFPRNTFVFLSVFLLIAATFELIRTGAILNMGQSRSVVHETVETRSVLVNYSLIVSMALSVLAGYEIISRLAYSKKSISFFLFFPLVANLLFSVTLGGRVNLIYSFAYYFIGAAFAFGIESSIWYTLKKYKRELWIIIVGFLLATTFITIVGRQRAIDTYGVRSEEDIYISELSPVLGVLYGPISYVVSSYTGYQYRRVDAVDPNQMGYGRFTFNGFINWTIPFAGQLGLNDFSIAKELGIYYHNQETYDLQREYYFCTHSCYLPIFKDFGFWGAFFCILFLTLIAHISFVKIQSRKTIKHCYTLFFYLLFWDYWVKSNMYGTLSSSVMLPLYGLLIIDLFTAIISSSTSNKIIK